MSAEIDFPKDFLFGAASSAYQIEGAVKQDGKSENIWDALIHKNKCSNVFCVTDPKKFPKDLKKHIKFVGFSKGLPLFKIADEISDVVNYLAPKKMANADITCDSYNKTDVDIALLKELGVQAYRFSISWPRILPTGYDNEPNEKAILHYQDLIDKLIANNIKPLVTIYHWDLPQVLQEAGGWANSFIIPIFASYARFVYKTFGDKVKVWTTINEPRLVSEGYGGYYGMAPNLGEIYSGIGDYLTIRNLLLAHATAYRIYEKDFKPTQKGEVCICLDTTWGFPKDENSEGDKKAADLIYQHYVGIFMEPLITGEFPKSVLETIEETNKRKKFTTPRLVPFTKDEKDLLIDAYDFIALNYYSSHRVSMMTEQELEEQNDFKICDQHFNSKDNENTATSKDTNIGFLNTLKWFHKKCKKGTKLIICENGVVQDDSKTAEENTIDKIEYHRGILAMLSKAIKMDINVFGYCVWSLMDSFEWPMGYTHKYGIYEVDFENADRPRTKKGCFDFFNKLFTDKKLLPVDYS